MSNDSPTPWKDDNDILSILRASEFGPTLRPIVTKSGVRHWMLMDDYEVDLYDGNIAIIPKGTITNYASVPKYLRWALSNTDPYVIIPALVHDSLVNEWSRFNVARIYSRKNGTRLPPLKWSEAAKQFRYMIKSYKGPLVKAKANIAYEAIRMHGKLQGFQ